MSTEHYHTRHWPSTTMLSTARDFTNRARKENKETPFPYLVPSIFLSFAAVESGVNALIYRAWEKAVRPLVKKDAKKVIKPPLRASIMNKLLYFTYFLTGKTFDTQSNLWDRIRNLKKLRDQIVHYELEELSIQEAEQLEEDVPIKSNNGRPSAEILRESFYNDLFSREVTIDKVEEAIETASEILEKLYCFYYNK